MSEPSSAEQSSNGSTAGEAERVREYHEVRALLLGREQRAIDELRGRVDNFAPSADQIADVIPEALALRAGRDERLAHALAPTLENAFSESVQRNPQQLADVIYPTLGPAIRKAISEAIAGVIADINHALQEGFSMRGMRWRLEAWRSGVSYAQIVMKHALVYRVEQVYLIHKDTGLLLSHVTAADLKAPDADVISGMLTAIRDFVGDSFDTHAGGGLRTFTVGDVTMLVEPGPHAMIAAAIRGHHPPALLTKLQSTLEVIHLRFARPLKTFDGDNAPFEDAKPLLAECLETVLSTDRPRQRAIPRAAWILGAAAIVLLATAWFISRGRWNRAQSALAAEPGLVIINAHKGLRTWEFSGLRDPSARTASVVLASAGIDTTRVRGTWTPYVSADSAVVVARAARILAPPATVTMSLANDTLRLAGSASTDWLDRALTSAIPGATVVRTDDVTLELGAALAPFGQQISASRVLFPVGSAEFSDDATRALGIVARNWRSLQSGVGPAWRVELDIVGRTDTTGSQEINRMLSDDRARAVTRVLTSLGVPATSLTPRGVGTSQPLAAADRAEQARINRSASFLVNVRSVRRPTP